MVLPPEELRRIPPMFETLGDSERIAKDFRVRRIDAVDRVMYAMLREIRCIKADLYGGPRDPSPAGRVLPMRRAA